MRNTYYAFKTRRVATLCLSVLSWTVCYFQGERFIMRHANTICGHVSNTMPYMAHRRHSEPDHGDQRFWPETRQL